MIMISKAGWRLYGVAHQKIPSIWHSLLPFLRKVLSLPYSIDDEKSLHDNLVNNLYQLWLGFTPKGKIGVVMVSSIQERPSCKSCVIMYATGTQPHNWPELTKAVELWAKNIGCNRLEIVGRKGWIKLNKKIGFKPSGYILHKEI